MKATRTIVHIDPELCNGCGDCVPSCAEGAIRIIDGKARLVAENLCDGLGACLGNCPMGAITLEEREADAFDEASVHEHLQRLGPHRGDRGEAHGHEVHATEPAGCPSCPGALAREVRPREQRAPGLGAAAPVAAQMAGPVEGLTSWPIQLALVNPRADFLRQAKLLVAADCTAFALPGFHSRLAGGRVTLIGCPKLDNADVYVERLAAILGNNEIEDISLAIMEVPCCGGLAQVLRMAQRKAGTSIPVKTQVVTIDGEVEEAG
ncbi:MAG: 4Fe-4S binding protein [Bacillota bacterium]|nr:4Fe-4S binding protein [Bacillota bacterium]